MSSSIPRIFLFALLAASIVPPCVAAEACAGSFVPPRGVNCSNPDAEEYDYNCPPLWDEIEDCKLNSAYRDLIAKLQDDPQQVERLRASQRAWLQFRDADVALVVAHYGEGGSLGRSIAAMRRFQLTRARFKDLVARLADQEKW